MKLHLNKRNQVIKNGQKEDNIKFTISVINIDHNFQLSLKRSHLILTQKLKLVSSEEQEVENQP